MVVGNEWSFHQLSPYIGKIKSSIARFLIQSFTVQNDTILDPFCGAGTIPFEAWTLNRNTIASDLNKYGYVLTKAKLSPPKSLEIALKGIEHNHILVQKAKKNIDLRKVPKWVRDFFHKETLRETIAWFQVLESQNDFFMLSCLLGILHHQRPGFLSFPASHTVPYLRKKNFPPAQYPHLYEYRAVKERLSINKDNSSFQKTTST